MNQGKREAFIDALAQHIPEPTTELNFSSSFELLIAVVLSAQATDVSVNKATSGLFAQADTPKKMISLGQEGIKKHIKSIGLFNTKAKNILATCKILVDEYLGELPQNRKALEALPGVGRKTANVVLNTFFSEPVIAVDTHIFRVSNRTKLAPGKTPREVEERLYKVVPKKYLIDIHHLLILHGRYTCTARSPKCTQCVARPFCEYKEKGI